MQLRWPIGGLALRRTPPACAAAEARSRGVEPLGSLALRSAPPFMSCSSTSACPICAAMCAGVAPSVRRALASAPAASSSLQWRAAVLALGVHSRPSPHQRARARAVASVHRQVQRCCPHLVLHADNLLRHAAPQQRLDAVAIPLPTGKVKRRGADFVGNGGVRTARQE
eukprot:4651097-Prymnesium_polylepis.1